MEWDKRSLRVGAAVVLCAVVLRLMGSGALGPVLHGLERPEVLSFLMYLETGRRAPPSLAVTPEPTERTTVPTLPGEPVPRPAYSPDQGETVDIRYDGSYRPDLNELVAAPLEWDLADGEPAVLILHTHTSESYTPSPAEDYQESSPYRTLDEGYNMVSIGDEVDRLLTQGGITVIHDRSLHDYPSYNGSYVDAREAMEEYLEQYPTIRLVLDLHRDAAEDGDGQMDTSAQVSGEESAQLMLVVGTDEGGLDHPGWRDNLSLALKLYVQLETRFPGICRPLGLRTERFNQDLSPGALLIEMGAAGNTHGEALASARALSQAILDLAKGSD